MKSIGYSDGYLYPHDYEENFVQQDYLPASLKESIYYQPTDNGFEKKFKERLARLWAKYKK
jgi:putative ATPase